MQVVTLREIINSIGFEFGIPDNVLFLIEMKGIVDVIATPNNYDKRFEEIKKAVSDVTMGIISIEEYRKKLDL